MSEPVLNIVLCDDKPETVMPLEVELRRYLEKQDIGYQISKYRFPSEAFEAMKSDAVHILFMDLEFGEREEDGILWIKKIHEEYPETLVLILTAYENRYKEGYRVRAFRFMTKPVIRQELEDNLKDCFLELGELHTISLRQKNMMFTLPVQDVIYMEAYLGESKLYTAEKVFYSEESLLQWEKKLVGSHFFRIHKSYLINLSHVTEIVSSRHEVILDGKIRLSVSRRKWTEFQKRYMQYDVAGGKSFHV